jgi:hypothetical protein
LAELETVENYIFATRKASLKKLQVLGGGGPLAVVVFAYEYRPARRTSHRRYADMAFARTGIGRVGTAPPRYDARLRGFTPIVSGQPNAVRVSPARYGAFLAVELTAKKSIGRPMRFRTQKTDGAPGDAKRSFWVPLHKIFSGPECLLEFPELDVEFVAHHLNEKIRRIHLQLAKPKEKAGKPFDTGWQEPDISLPPFQFTEGIAELGFNEDDPPGVLTPEPHKALVEPATYRGRPVGFNVPPDNGPYSSSLALAADYNEEDEEIRHAPAYVHARTKLLPHGEKNLNASPNVAEIVNRGGYMARHYVDYTGDGWVAPRISAMDEAQLERSRPAYSLVAPPDFLFACDQVQASDWSESLPRSAQRALWYEPPTPLSDERLPANLQMTNTPFTADDQTITAIVSLAVPEPTGKRFTGTARERPCHTCLPDDGAGIFAPGWDVARDWLPDRTQHYANYGLGSPFPEDTKLCAALSAFWIAVTPDATREFAFTEGEYRTVSPLTDEEIGWGKGAPWDDVPPPKAVKVGRQTYAEFASFAHTDYALSALAGRLSLYSTGRIGEREYQDRTLAMATAYKALRGKRDEWVVLSYRMVGENNPERRRAEKATGRKLEGDAHRFDMFQGGKLISSRKAPFKQRLLMKERTTVFVDGTGLVLMGRNGTWKRRKITWK